MMRTLLRRVGLLPGLVLFLLALGASRPAQASHFLGGELTYKYLDANGPASAPQRYEITLSVYNNDNQAQTPVPPYLTATVGIFDQANNNKYNLTTVNYSGASGGNLVIPETSRVSYAGPPLPPGCQPAGANQPYILQRFIAIVNLPLSTVGYYAEFDDGSRNSAITNLLNGGSQNITLYTSMAPPALSNHSPVFADDAIGLICANDTTYLLNNAIDADGDQLIYTFGQPYGRTLPATFTVPPGLAYNPNYTALAPLGTAAIPGRFARLDPATGLAKYRATTTSNQFVVAIDVKEYRIINGVSTLIGTTRRDIQLVVGVCPPTVAPLLPTFTSSTGQPGIPRNYTVEAGGTLTIPLVATQVAGNPLELIAGSILLDGVGGYDATLGGSTGTVVPGNPAGSATITGAGLINTSFTFKPSCTQVRAQPYDLTLRLADKSCGGKTTFDVIRITVVKPSGPTAINGDDVICGLNTVHSYSSSGGTAPKVSWRVVGGTLLTPPTNNPVQVQWTTAGTGLIVARGIGVDGCPTDSVSKTVNIIPAPNVGVTGVQALCQGASTSLSFTGSTTYTITGGATTLTGAGPFTFTPSQTTMYTVTGAAPASGCPPTGQFTLTVLPAPTATAGPAMSTCSGTPVTIGSAPVAGYTYSWTPTTGLSNPNIANPTVTLTNTSGAPTTTTYTLTALNANFCPATNSVVVTVNPRPAPFTITGPLTLCGTTSTATYTVANPSANATYQWTVTGGTITSGQGTASITVTYAATAATASISVVGTSAQGCASNPVTLAITTDFAQAPRLVSASVDPGDNTKIVLTINVPAVGSTTNAIQVFRRAAGSTAAYTALGTVPASATTYTDASVNAAQNSYEYSLSRTNGCGTSLSAPQAATTILLKAQPNAQTGVTNLTWNAYQGFTVANYLVYRSDNGNTGTYNQVATVPGSTLSYVNANTGQGFNQCFRVVAIAASPSAATSNSNTVCVDFERGTTVMNVVTPNGDNKNDYLYIKNAPLYPNNKVTVYNRWGREVFSTTGYNNATNTWGSEDSVAPGVYYYLVQLPDGTSSRGWVEVVK